MSLWHSQWELFAPNFHDGRAHIHLNPYGCAKTLQLIPGPGFGDFSHPTTRLTLQLMAPHITNRPVIDIGCGSGILSLAASALGAQSVYGFDIDPDAVLHARQNGHLNNSPALFHTSPPPPIPPHSILLMNMIASEQMAAWNSFLPSITTPFRIFTSGVLDKTTYLTWCKQNQWTLIQSLQEDNWWAFEFTS